MAFCITPERDFGPELSNRSDFSRNRRFQLPRTACQEPEQHVQEAHMNRDELRARQRPLKDRYRSDSTAALVTLHAEGALDRSDVTCSVQTGRALIEAGLHPATGGNGASACSGDMLLQALVACAGVTLRAVATNRGIDVTGTVLAEGDLDFRGTMGVDRTAPVGFRAIRLRFDLESDATSEELDALVTTTEQYCVVLQTLARAPELTLSRT
jgi:uncharacterized OsmC-like protein